MVWIILGITCLRTVVLVATVLFITVFTSIFILFFCLFRAIIIHSSLTTLLSLETVLKRCIELLFDS